MRGCLLGLKSFAFEHLLPAVQNPGELARAERTVLAAQARGAALHDLTNHAEHVAALDRGERSALAFRIDD